MLRDCPSYNSDISRLQFAIIFVVVTFFPYFFIFEISRCIRYTFVKFSNYGCEYKGRLLDCELISFCYNKKYSLRRT